MPVRARPSSLRRFVASSLSVGRRAFSLVELMVVIVILGMLAGIATYATSSYLQKAKVNRARIDLAKIAGAVESFYADKGRYPENQEGLKALAPEYLTAIPNDPWGRPYQYVQPGRTGAYDVICYGADGREGGAGGDADITNRDVEGGKK